MEASTPSPPTRGLLRRRRVRDPRREARRAQRISPRRPRAAPSIHAPPAFNRPRGGRRRRAAHRRSARDGDGRGALVPGPAGMRGAGVDVRGSPGSAGLRRPGAQAPFAPAPGGWAGVDAGQGETGGVDLHAAAFGPGVDRSDAYSTH